MKDTTWVRPWEVAYACPQMVIVPLLIIAASLAPLNVYGNSSDNVPEWFVAGAVWFLAFMLGFLWFPWALDRSVERTFNRRIDRIVGSRRTRFRKKAIVAIPDGDCVVIDVYERVSLTEAKHRRERFPASAEQDIYEYVNAARQGPEPVRHADEAIAISRVINDRRNR